MDALFADTLSSISRRRFLKLAGGGLLSFFFSSMVDVSAVHGVPSGEHGMGRVVANGIKTYDKPSFNAKVRKATYMDLILPIMRITIGSEEPSYNRIWYDTGEGYIHSGSVQPVKVQTSTPLAAIPEEGLLAEVTVPYTDCLWHPRHPNSIAYRFYYSTVHWIIGLYEDEDGKLWYRVPDDKWRWVYYADANHLRPILPDELTPLSAETPLESKRLEVRLDEQVVVAYEEDKPVFMTRAATGAKFSDGDYRTPVGKYITNRKRPSRHMAAGDPAAPNSYDLPGIPWVSYLTKSGISFHGTYWHNDFGKPRSHGCINLSSGAARWIYRWSTPHVPLGERTYAEETGTAVDVIGD